MLDKSRIALCLCLYTLATTECFDPFLLPCVCLCMAALQELMCSMCRSTSPTAARATLSVCFLTSRNLYTFSCAPMTRSEHFRAYNLDDDHQELLILAFGSRLLPHSAFERHISLNPILRTSVYPVDTC